MMYSDKPVGWQIRLAGTIEAQIPTVYDFLDYVMIPLFVPNPLRISSDVRR